MPGTWFVGITAVRCWTQRYFWLVGVGFAVASGWLGYRGVRQFAAEVAVGPASPGPLTAVRGGGSSDGQEDRESSLVERNMFCSSCAPATLVAPVAGDDAVPRTALPLELLATSVASLPAESLATVRHGKTGNRALHGVGGPHSRRSRSPPVGGTAVDFHNPATGRLERLSLISAPTGVGAPAAPRPRGTSDRYTDRVRMTGNTTYQVHRSLVDELAADPRTARGVRFVPRLENGTMLGLRLHYARPGTIALVLGLRRGDVVRSINGHELTSIDNALQAYAVLRQQHSFQVEVLRDGAPLTLSYEVVP